MSEIGPGVQMDEPAPSEPNELAVGGPSAVQTPDPVWTPPAADAGGGGWGGGSGGWSGWSGWGYPLPGPETPPAPAPRPVRRGIAVAAIVAMAMASGGVGVAIGAAWHRGPSSGSSRSSASPAVIPGGSGSSSPGATLPTVGGNVPAGSGALDVAAIADKVDPAVVDITTTLAGGEAAGTGMVLTSSGLVLTNNHVIDGATEIRAQIGGTGPTYPAKVVGYDVTDDVALLQLETASGLKTVNVGDSSKVSVDDPVVAIGNALGRGGTPTATQGTVGALDQSITANDTTGSAETLNGMIEINAPIQPGDSGGPLVNAGGQVIGMNTAASGGYRRFSASRVAFAIPINRALSIARQIQAGQSSGTVHLGPRAILGVEVQDPSQSGFGGPFDGGAGSTTPGAPVVGVQAGSPAQSAGLVAGDVIVAIGGKSVSSAADLRSALADAKPGDRVSVSWLDQSGTRHTATVQLAAGPPA